MRRLLLSAYIVTIVLLFPSCMGRSKTSLSQEKGDTLRLSYAENLTIVKFEHYTKVELKDPWHNGKILHTYLLVNRADSSTELPEEGTIVPIPFKKAVVNPSMHCNLFVELFAGSSIKGVCDLQYIKTPFIQKEVKKGNIADCGNGMNPNVEKIIEIHPDIIFLSPFENSGGYGRLDKLGIPIVECADYMETSPLGRAEWMKFYGILCGKAQEANQLFKQVEEAYLSTKKTAQQTTTRPTVLCDLKTGATWYVPGGRSTTGKLIEDAGAKYIFGKLTNSGSKSLSFETVLNEAQNADFWFFKYNQLHDKTLEELKTDFEPYTRFSAYQKGKVYGCNTRYQSFYEESPFHPETVLKDMVKIFHPELLPNYELRFFSKLKQK